MDLFKWTKNFKPTFPNVIEKFFGNRIDEQTDKTEEIATVPSVNISERDKAFEVSLAAPGIDKKDIKLEVHDGCLMISSEKQYENEESNGNWMRREYGYASFQRMFQLPDNADPEKVQANMKNGILKIKIGKKKGLGAGLKQVPVQ